MKAVLLPGLDGTGALHEDFVAALGMKCCVMRYPAEFSSYDDLREYVLGGLPDDDHVLIAESFSGPLAIQLAHDAPSSLKGIVFVASFARAPRPAPTFLASALRFMPVKSRVACQMMQPAVMGRWASRAFTKKLWAALKTVPAATMAKRLEQILRVDETDGLQRVNAPMLYLRASVDRLVPGRASRPFELAGAKVSEIVGPHFLLQANPADAAQAVRVFVKGLGLEPDAPTV